MFVSSENRFVACLQSLVKERKVYALIERDLDGCTELLVDPVMILTVRDGVLTKTTPDGHVRTDFCSLQSVDEEVEYYRQRYDVFGYLGYDCARYLEDHSLPTIATVEPEACFCAFARREVIKRESLKTSNARDRKTETISADAEFCYQISEIFKHIKDGDVFQCVISKRFCTPFADDGISLYDTLRRTNPSPYHFLFQLEGVAIVGASPETLIKTDGDAIEMHPIAGTRPRGETIFADHVLEKQLLASGKESAEHLMLVDLARNDLGRVCVPGSVQVSSFRRVERLSHVMHLVSTVRGKLRHEISMFGALLSCFPAGTLTGAPKISAMKIISRLESERRGAYGGAIIYAEKAGGLDSCINIRSAVLANGTAYYQAGAGIVAESDPEQEFMEIINKSAAVRHALRSPFKDTATLERPL